MTSEVSERVRSLAEAPTRIQSAMRRRRASRHVAVSAAINADVLTPLLVNPMEGRTGSTLLMRLLGTSPAVAFDRAYPYENRYLTYLSRLVEHMAEPLSSTPDWDVSVLLEGPPDKIGPLPFKPELVNLQHLQKVSTRALWSAFSEAVWATSGDRAERYYAEKAWGRTIALLDGAGVRSRVINLVRDPRDVVASIKTFDDQRGFFGFGRVDGQSDEDYLDWLLAVMNSNLTAMRARPDDADTTWVHYESLVGDLDGVARSLSEWLSIDLSADEATGRARDYRRHSTSSTPQASVGRWRADLTEREARRVESVLGEEMARLGYSC